MRSGPVQVMFCLLALGVATAMARAVPLRGVVEGYHGHPWSGEARRDVIGFIGARGMNTFVYGPKSDPFHRDRWREPYPADTLADLRVTADAARRARVRFVYALSPGLDACYACRDDFRALTRKLLQLARGARVRRFALFFDDAPATLTRPEDVARHGGSDATAVGRAQADLVSRVDRWLRRRNLPALALVVPTAYAGTACEPYHAALAGGLPARLPIAWTGSGIFSRTLTGAQARARRECLAGHPVVLWDNFPANDTVLSNTLHLGPLVGRDAELPAAVAGYLLNPMPQARPSLIGLGTAAAYLADPARYDPEVAWRDVLAALDPTGQLAVLAEQTRGSPLDDPDYGDAPALAAAVAAVERDGESADWMAAVETLEAELRRQAEAAAALARDPRWDEAAPWIAELAAHAAGGLEAARLLRAMKPAFVDVGIDADGALRGRVVPPDAPLAAALAPAFAAPRPAADIDAYLACLGGIGRGEVHACPTGGGRACDGGACCSPPAPFFAPGTVCRAAMGPCDVAESCSGDSASCPADAVKAAGTVCRAASGACDLAETCSGSAAACPTDRFAADGTSCTDGNPCNGTETCQSGACAAGTAPACDDGNVCTDDACSPGSGCVFTDNTAPCSDGIACTADVCAGGACRSTPACATGETCNLVTGLCDPPALTSIEVTPATPTLRVGAEQRFAAVGTYLDGTTRNLTAQAAWASSTAGTATIDAGGRATAVAPGSTTISATLGTVSGSTTLDVQPLGAITTSSLAVGVVGAAYAASLEATGGTPPYAWSIADGALPEGLILDASTGTISGTPTSAGVSTVTIQVAAEALTATRAFTLSVAQNAIAAENALPGAPASEWDVAGAGDPDIQGFATDISVDQGDRVQFKIKTDALDYRIDIYRLGYYAGMGARRVASVQPSATLPQAQPNCLTQPTTGLVDCGTWAISASWSVPATATSGIYIAKLVREDPEDGRASHVPFIVRDDDGGSDILFQTADTTWQAYNSYGGASLYWGSAGGRATKVSYNRPFSTRCCKFPTGKFESFVFGAEYPMLRWLERNGYDVSYSTGVDADRRGAEMFEHRVYMPVGHDEYWSGGQRANVEAARAAGVHLAIFSGNHGFAKTRWENSIDGTGTRHRTLVCYKETEADAKVDPLPGVWTGTWRDDRFGPHDGGRPENALNGSIFMVNGVRNDPMEVPSVDGRMRFWRNTSIASLGTSQKAVLPAGVLGHEWDEDLDNGHRPPGLVHLSTTTITGVQRLRDEGESYTTQTATHNLTLYRHASGALVFGAGTVQWSWGLDDQHDRPGTPTDPRMQQATVNLLADMGVQPVTLQSGLTAATASTDVTPPTATILWPTNDASVAPGSSITIAGAASDTDGRVGGVEVSTDGGATWHPASGRTSWTYVWTVTAAGSVSLRARAVDDSGNLGPASTAVTVTAPSPATSSPSAGGTPQLAATGTIASSAVDDDLAAGSEPGASCAPPDGGDPVRGADPEQLLFSTDQAFDLTALASCLDGRGTGPAAFGLNVHGKGSYLVPFSLQELRLVTGKNVHRRLLDVVADRWRAWAARQPPAAGAITLVADGRAVAVGADGTFVVPGTGAGTRLVATTAAGDATAIVVK